MHQKDIELQLLLDAVGERFIEPPRLISREPYGSGSIVGFSAVEDAVVAYGDSRAEGTATTTWYVDTSGRRVVEETGLVLGEPERPEARIWLHPADPYLPALSPATFDRAAEVLLGRMGLQLAAPPELLAYRPGKRAVLRMLGTDTTSYLKVVRPKVVSSLVQSHTELAAAGLPVPEVIAWSNTGLLVIGAAAGEQLSKAVPNLDPEQLLDEIDSLRRRLAVVELGKPGRQSLTERTDWYLQRLDQAVDHHPELAEPAEPLRELLTEKPPVARQQTVHGDLHIGQLFVTGGKISGLIDVDTAGRGNPVDDEAAFIGHLIATGVMRGRAGADPTPFERLARLAAARWHSDELDYGVAVHALGHGLLPAGRGDVELASAILQRGAEVLRR